MKSYISKFRFECSKLKGGAVLIKTPLEWDHIAIVRDSTTCETVIDQTLLQKASGQDGMKYIFFKILGSANHQKFPPLHLQVNIQLHP